jgi:hypothetical protein
MKYIWCKKPLWCKKNLKLLVISVSLFSAILGFIIIFIFRPYSSGNPPNIPQGWGDHLATKFKGNIAQPKPINLINAEQNPFLAKTNANNMHVNSLASDVHTLGGPLGKNSQIKSYAHGSFGGECASILFDSKGNIVAVCATFKEFSLLLMSPKDLIPLAQMSLPPRASGKSYDLEKIMSDTSGGAYFFLDNQDRAVLVDANQHLKVISQQWKDGHVNFVIDHEYDLLPTIKSYSVPEDVITSIMPDWHGRYWFVSRFGLIGVFNSKQNRIEVLKLPKEEIQNSFVIDKDGAYVVSDRALYKISASLLDDKPIIAWKETYQRAENKKPGTLTVGSGTTPTLLANDLVAIADNADPQVNVLVYHRSDKLDKSRLVCKVPIFKPGESTTENSFIGIGNSLIIENNYGYTLFPKMMFGQTGTGGITRVDVVDNNSCQVKWENPIISQTTVPKLSLETGLIYVYAKDPNVGYGADIYYLSALDFNTGKTVFEIFVGAGVSYDNNWAPITLGEKRCAYVGVLRGMTQVCDGE